MGQYKLKEPAVIEAFQYLGTAAEATPIIDWVLGHGGTARYREFTPEWENEDGTVGYGKVPEHIYISDDLQSQKLLVGQWVLRIMDSLFFVMNNEDFIKLYDPVDPLENLRWKLTGPQVHINGPQTPTDGI